MGSVVLLRGRFRTYENVEPTVWRQEFAHGGHTDIPGVDGGPISLSHFGQNLRVRVVRIRWPGTFLRRNAH